MDLCYDTIIVWKQESYFDIDLIVESEFSSNLEVFTKMMGGNCVFVDRLAINKINQKYTGILKFGLLFYV